MTPSGAKAAHASGAVLVAALVLLAPPAARGFSPQVNYQLHCQGCHMADGRATPGLVPPLDSTLGRFVRVPEGRAYLLRLPNVAAAQLDDAATAELLNWVVDRFAADASDAGFDPYTADEVARGRQDPLVDLEAARRAALDAVGGGE